MPAGKRWPSRLSFVGRLCAYGTYNRTVHVVGRRMIPRQPNQSNDVTSYILTTVDVLHMNWTHSRRLGSCRPRVYCMYTVYILCTYTVYFPPACRIMYLASGVCLPVGPCAFQTSCVLCMRRRVGEPSRQCRVQTVLARSILPSLLRDRGTFKL
jgi:hypothetical protein